MTRVTTDVSRRTLLKSLAAAPVAALGIAPAWAQSAASAAGLVTPNVCMVMPEVTEGPYYLDPGLIRADITEGKTGIPLKLTMQVVDAQCAPFAGARVDIWHCDAEGNYSGYSGQGSDSVNDTQGETFLRGTQFTGDGGLVTFDTIYPGWYRGRTTHIHYKVFLDETTVLTSQIFFPDALSQYLFDTVAPYNARSGARDTVNSNDWIAAQAGDGAFAAIREQANKYTAALVVGVNPDAVSATGMRNRGPAGGATPRGSSDTRSLIPGQ
ncbi:intradiol ring-cleavage dioxygenase [Actibacterium lipolyticum]|uniref:Catechol 1,2-dioxygenase n=1 Tax=Actibacterium lipolyticum TaxID=1524263 RepID=A0A238JRZ8_9RHOB|nr:intradiol ring-cleavage dioxygenase [Actibacterium lipolyticum]SMX33431.1 Catechol 1,2-dioxygenase [Actibacterium lipolyticum]